MPKVSIVVPVYKAEKYLVRCVKSLSNQTLKDIEIILVDDGSPDNCGHMCDEFEKTDSRIKVVHKKNGGLSSARNAGLEVAIGETVGFVDSDDDVELTMYEELYETLISNQVDFVMSDYLRIENSDVNCIKTANLREGYFTKNDIKKEIYPQLIMGRNLDYGPLLSVCQCLYKREFLIKNHLMFADDVKWSEDNLFSAMVGYYANSFYYLKNRPLYHYYNNPGTITTSYKQGSWEVYSRMNDYLQKFFSKKTDYDFSEQLKLHMIYYACNSLNQIKSAEMSRSNKMELYARIMKSNKLQETFIEFHFPKEWSWKLKVQIYLIKRKLVALYNIL
ncbi:glycosyltransferase family 2 protein [Catenibacterium mitsuokai]|uniref:glycosyltransferase family 2 protein n=1 Tax=Catenibacterium mitsuokai TaxID=100886 RepID=UPI003F8A296A